MKKNTFIIVLSMIAVIAFPGSKIAASESLDAQAIVDQSTAVFKRFVTDKEFTIFQQNIGKAQALLIIPQVLKAGFVWGGSGGNGVLLVRDKKTGEWSQPAFYTVGSVSFGLQIGAEDAEVIMLAMNQKAVDTLFTSSFKLGGDISVAVGPEGAGAKKIVNADFISFSKAKGLYAGLDLEGSGVHVRDDLNKAYYGREVRPVEIILQRIVENQRSNELRAVVKKGIAIP
jgi:lipid-binding SYLF domain-containing protein